MKNLLLIVSFLACQFVYAQIASEQFVKNDTSKKETSFSQVVKQFNSTSEFLDAAINSINSFNSLIKKENYRNKITSFNNPTSSDMGFNLENEIQLALKPLLAKAKNVSVDKFSQVVSTLLITPAATGSSFAKTAVPSLNPVFSTLLSLVGTLTIQEKRITRNDLDSFILNTSRYFGQYEKLNQANVFFDQNIERLNIKLTELQYDLKEYMLDMISLLHKSDRSNFKKLNAEELFLKYFDVQKIKTTEVEIELRHSRYPSDGIKSAKDIANNLQKLFNDYQKVYAENNEQIKAILIDSKKLGKNINVRQVDASLKELEELYSDSKNADILSLRLNTLTERLKALVATEQLY